ncbi:MAG: CatB-related O-acetyltransferase [Ruminococcus sp.]|nr:CatB-related O-acetyltransferase [Ruminococcus sp.]
MYSAYLSVRRRKVRLSLSTKVKPGTVIADNVKIGRKTWIKGKIGSYTYIGENCEIDANIGSFCSISRNVRTIGAVHPKSFLSTAPVFYSTQKQCGASFAAKDVYDEGLYIKEDGMRSVVKIGNDVWIGENVMLKGGIRIGDGAIIAMGAVVTKDVAPYTIVGGVPAKVISKRFDDSIIEKLVSLKWWEKDAEWLRQNAEHFQREITDVKDLDFLMKG